MVINSQKENVVDRVMELTGAQGIQVSVGMAFAEQRHHESASASPDGTVCIFCSKLPKDLSL